MLWAFMCWDWAWPVERYNELAAKGEDEDFGKESYRLSSLNQAPFYGVRQAGGYLICTMDGIQIDDNMHAIDQDFKAIPGLYVIGDMSGNYFSGSYPSLMAGAAAGRSATFGDDKMLDDRNLTANYFYARVLITFEYLMDLVLEKDEHPNGKEGQ